MLSKVNDENVKSTLRQKLEALQSIDFNSLPTILQNLCSTFEDEHKEMMLLSNITVISSILPNVFGEYAKERVYPNLYLYVLGKAGSGKGNLLWSRRLLSEIESNKPQNNSGGLLNTMLNSQTVLIPNKIVIPANNSSAGFVKMLNEREGKGLIFETEGDTIANVFKTDYGNYSDMLRKAFHHEPISQYRKTDNVYVDLPEPKLSVVISSTPNQLKRIVSNAENGLYSRFMYWHTEPMDEFFDVFASGDGERSKTYTESAVQLNLLFQQLLQVDGIHFSYSDEQKEVFLDFFNRNKAILTNLFHADLDGTANRMGLIAFRISMILTILRNIKIRSNTYVCSDEDFCVAMKLSEKLLNNANRVLEILPMQEVDELSAQMLLLYQSLPNEFTTAEAKQIAHVMGVMSARNVDRFLGTLCVERTKRGRYRKVA